MAASNSLMLNFLLSINKFKKLKPSTIINCEFTGNFMEYVVCNINTTLYPNDELRIDSDLFNVMINGQNAIHLQQGDWIYLDKNSKDILIETGTGGLLNGQIIYKERFL